jgi:hypothetical protein
MDNARSVPFCNTMGNCLKKTPAPPASSGTDAGTTTCWDPWSTANTPTPTSTRSPLPPSPTGSCWTTIVAVGSTLSTYTKTIGSATLTVPTYVPASGYTTVSTPPVIIQIVHDNWLPEKLAYGVPINESVQISSKHQNDVCEAISVSCVPFVVIIEINAIDLIYGSCLLVRHQVSESGHV